MVLPFAGLVKAASGDPILLWEVEIHWATAGGRKDREEASSLPYEGHRDTWAPLTPVDAQSSVLCDREASHHS